jgi:hypothetical protein
MTIRSGVSSTLAGQFEVGTITNGQGTAATFSNPYGIAVASDLTVYVGDSVYIRKITSSGTYDV